MCLLCIMLSPCVVTPARLYDSSPEESLHVPIKFLAVECASVKILVVVKVVIGVMKPDHVRLGCSVAAVGGV